MLEPVSGFPVEGGGAGERWLWTEGEGTMRPAFPGGTVLGVLGPPFPTERGPAAGEGTFMYAALLLVGLEG